MKRTMMSKEEFERLVDLEVQKGLKKSWEEIYERGRSVGWQEGYAEAERDAAEMDI